MQLGRLRGRYWCRAAELRRLGRLRPPLFKGRQQHRNLLKIIDRGSGRRSGRRKGARYHRKRCIAAPLAAVVTGPLCSDASNGGVLGLLSPTDGPSAFEAGRRGRGRGYRRWRRGCSVCMHGGGGGLCPRDTLAHACERRRTRSRGDGDGEKPVLGRGACTAGSRGVISRDDRGLARGLQVHGGGGRRSQGERRRGPRRGLPSGHGAVLAVPPAVEITTVHARADCSKRLRAGPGESVGGLEVVARHRRVEMLEKRRSIQEG